MRLSDNSFRILNLVCSYCNKEGITWVSHKSLSEDMGVSRQAITKQITNLRNLGYIQIIKKGFRSTHSNTLKVIFDETQLVVDQLEVDDNQIDVEAQKNVIQMINKAFNKQPQLDAQSSTKRSESVTVRAMKEHIKRVKNNAS
jgi:biotin operon repressor/predicted DNA binding CopG/RHH family protein